MKAKSCQQPLNLFGNLQEPLKQYRLTHRREMAWDNCRAMGFARWKKASRQAVLTSLHYHPGPLNLKPRREWRREFPDFIAERLTYQSAPWFSVPAYFLLPKHGRPPYPAVYLMHEWGGNPLFGKERVIQFGDEHPILQEHQRTAYGGRSPANAFTRRGYAVLVADAFYFGERGPRGFAGIPFEFDPAKSSIAECVDYHQKFASSLYTAVRYLMWAGTTWAGVNTWDDIRGMDYLASRPEVDRRRLACAGLSGGGWRTNLLAALDDRVRASASIMWMSTGDEQHDYNVAGAIGAFCLLPGLWQQLDVPDFSVMAAPNATLVVSGAQDPLFPAVGKAKSATHIRQGFTWAGCLNRFKYYKPDKPHCFDIEVQETVLDWFDRFLTSSRLFVKTKAGSARKPSKVVSNTKTSAVHSHS